MLDNFFYLISDIFFYILLDHFLGLDSHRIAKSTFTFKMSRFTRYYDTFQNVTNHAHFSLKNYGGKNNRP